MDISHLKEFVTLASHLKLTSAARELYMSPSTLSQHISALEREVGAELFSRSNGLELTRQGEAVLEHAQAILFEYDALLKSCASDQEQNLRISVPNNYLGEGPLLRARERFLETHSGCKVILNSNELQKDDPIEIVSNGASTVSVVYIARDCGYTIEDKLPQGISYIHAALYRCVFVSTRQHPLANKEILTSDDLNGATVVVILSPISALLMDSVQRVLARYATSLKVVLRPHNRNLDAFQGDLGNAYVMWFEPVKGSGSALPDLPIHRYEHDLLADAYYLYREDKLNRLQLEYMEAVKEVCGEDLS